MVTSSAMIHEHVIDQELYAMDILLARMEMMNVIVVRKILVVYC